MMNLKAILFFGLTLSTPVFAGTVACTNPTGLIVTMDADLTPGSVITLEMNGLTKTLYINQETSVVNATQTPGDHLFDQNGTGKATGLVLVPDLDEELVAIYSGIFYKLTCPTAVHPLHLRKH